MKFPVLLVAGALAAAAALTACSSTSSTSTTPPDNSATPGASSTGASTGASPTGSALTIADVAPFSGPDAALGPTYLASSYGATSAINSAGGVLGHQFTCQ